jgi:hypothetical protein
MPEDFPAGQFLRKADKYIIHCIKSGAVFGKLKMDPAKRAQTQNAGEV